MHIKKVCGEGTHNTSDGTYTLNGNVFEEGTDKNGNSVIVGQGGETTSGINIDPVAEQRVIDAGYDKNIIVDVVDGVPIPKGFTASTILGENTKADGLVIKDGIGNEFVWIPATLNGANGTVKYEKWLTVGLAYNGTIDDSLPSGITNEKSQIEIYGGFYISRYEAGLPTNIMQTMATVAVRNTNGIPLSKQNAVPWNYIDYNHAKTNAESMYSNSYVQSGLVTGTQWDTVMKWLQNAGYNVTADSGTWGNYSNTGVTGITNYSTDEGATWINANTKPINTGGLLKTGNSNFTKAKNIYDLAGNVFEWINETNSFNHVFRGGFYNVGSVGCPSGYRGDETMAGASAGDFLGFRIALFIK